MGTDSPAGLEERLQSVHLQVFLAGQPLEDLHSLGGLVEELSDLMGNLQAPSSL